jgi:membrane-associated protein
MEIVSLIFDFIMNIDQHLLIIIKKYGVWAYFILFMIIFCETGLVVTPFLPGDSLLFALGALAALGVLNLWLVLVILIAAAIMGDTVTHQFYKKHGGKTIIIARFMPVIRTFAPFVAGMGDMNYAIFLFYNVIGGFLWICAFIFCGYFFGNIPVVEKNFTLVIFGVIFMSLVPGFAVMLTGRLKLLLSKEKIK